MSDFNFNAVDSKEWLALLKLQTLIFNSSLNPAGKLIHLVTQTPDNEMSSIAAVTSRIGLDIKVSIGGFYHPACNRPLIIRQKLLQLGFPWDGILIIDLDHEEVGPGKRFEYHNTRTEMEMVVRYCLQNSIYSLGVSAPPFHQVRSYMHTISALKKFNQPDTIKVFSFPGWPLNWFANAKHSQGITTGERHSLIDGEIERIFNYAKMGDLLQPSEVLAYFLRVHGD